MLLILKIKGADSTETRYMLSILVIMAMLTKSHEYLLHKKLIERPDLKTVGIFLPHSVTDVLAQFPKSSIKDQNAAPLDITDSIYNANTSKFLGSKNISLTLYRTTEEHYFEQGFLNNVGNVTNNQTFFNNYLSDELLLGRGKGTIETSDRQNITWISSDLGRSIDNRWVFYVRDSRKCKKDLIAVVKTVSI